LSRFGPVGASLSSIDAVQELVIRELPIAETRALRQSVLRPHQSIADLAAHEQADAFAVGAYDDDELIAVGFVAPDNSGGWRVRGMASAALHRGRGAGGAILEALVAHATDHGARRIWCNARVGARSLYERGGFEVASEEFELPQIGPHYVMEKVVR
jgi:GNAT superfamily N-acetyltransferase